MQFYKTWIFLFILSICPPHQTTRKYIIREDCVNICFATTRPHWCGLWTSSVYYLKSNKGRREQNSFSMSRCSTPNTSSASLMIIVLICLPCFCLFLHFLLFVLKYSLVSGHFSLLQDLFFTKWNNPCVVSLNRNCYKTNDS